MTTTTAHEDQFTPAPVEVTRADYDRALKVFDDILCDMGNYAEFGAPHYKHVALETIAEAFARHRIAHPRARTMRRRPPRKGSDQ